MRTIRDRKKSGTRMRIISTLLIISLIFTGLSGVGNYQVYAETTENEQESEPIVTPTPEVENENPDGDNDPIEETTYDFEGSVNASNGMIILQSGLIIKESETGYEEVGTLVEGSYTFEDGSILHANGTITEPEETPEPEVTPTPEVTDNSELIASIISTIDSIINSPVFLSNVMEIEDPENTEVSREDKIAALKRELLIYAEDEYPELVPYITDLSDFSETELNTIESREVLASLNALLGEIYSFIEMPVAMLGAHGPHDNDSNITGIHDGCTFNSCTIKNAIIYESEINNSQINLDVQINNTKINQSTLDSGKYTNCTIDASTIYGGTFSGCSFTDCVFDANNRTLIINDNSVISAPNKNGYANLINVYNSGKFIAENVAFNNIKADRVIRLGDGTGVIKNCLFENNNGVILARTDSEATIENSNFNNNSGVPSGYSQGIDLDIYEAKNIILKGNSFSAKEGSVAEIGGSIYFYNGVLSVDNCNFSNYHASRTGGAIYSNGSINIQNSSFSNNSAQDGGALYIIAVSDVNISNSSFENNEAVVDGGAICFAGDSGSSHTLTLDNVVIQNNSCINKNTDSIKAGGLLLKDCKLIATGNTVIKDNNFDYVESNLLIDSSYNMNTADSSTPTGNKFNYVTLGTAGAQFIGEIYFSAGNTTETSAYNYIGSISRENSSEDSKLYFDNSLITKFGPNAQFLKYSKDNKSYWVLSIKNYITKLKLGINTNSFGLEKNGTVFKELNGSNDSNRPQAVVLEASYYDGQTEIKYENVLSDGILSIDGSVEDNTEKSAWYVKKNNVSTKMPGTHVISELDTNYILSPTLHLTNNATSDNYLFNPDGVEIEVVPVQLTSGKWEEITDRVFDVSVNASKLIIYDDNTALKDIEIVYPGFKHLLDEKGSFVANSSVSPVKNGDNYDLNSNIEVNFKIASTLDLVENQPGKLKVSLYKKIADDKYELIPNSNFNIVKDTTGNYKGTFNSLSYSKTGRNILIVVQDKTTDGGDNRYVNDDTSYSDESGNRIKGIAITHSINNETVSQVAPVITVEKSIETDNSKEEPEVKSNGKLKIDLTNANAANVDKAFEYYCGDIKNIKKSDIKTLKSTSNTLSKEESVAGYYSVRYPAVYYAEFIDDIHKWGIIYEGKDGYYYYDSTECKPIDNIISSVKLVDASDWTTVSLLADKPVVANVSFSYSHSGTSECGISEENDLLASTTKFHDKITATISIPTGMDWGELSKEKVGNSLKAKWYYINDKDEEILLKSDSVTKAKNVISLIVPYAAELVGKDIYLKIEPALDVNGDPIYHYQRVKKCLSSVSDHENTRKLPAFRVVNASGPDKSDGKIYGENCDKLTIDPQPWSDLDKNKHVTSEAFINVAPGKYTFKYAACDGFAEGTETKEVEIQSTKGSLGIVSLSMAHTNKGDCTLEGANLIPTALDTVTANFVLDSALNWGTLADGGYQYIGTKLEAHWFRYDEKSKEKTYIKDSNGKEVISNLSEDKSNVSYILTGEDVGYLIGVEIRPNTDDIFHDIVESKSSKAVVKHPAITTKPRLTGTDVTATDKKDGKISSSKLEKLEYKFGKDGKWISVVKDTAHYKNGELTGLEKGTYYFRYAETDTNLVGTEIFELTIKVSSSVTPSPTPGSNSDIGDKPKLVPSAQRTDSASPDPVAAADPEITEAVVDPDALAEIQKIKSSIASSDKIIVPNGENVYSQAELSSSEQELYDAVLTEEDKLSGKHITVSISCNKKMDGLTADEMNSIKGIAKGKEIGDVYDISIYKKYDTGEIVQVTETSKPVEIIVNVPLDIKNEGRGVLRKYSMIRFHHDELPVLIECTYDRTNDTVSFKSDKYSTYVLTYHDVPTVLSFGTWLWRLLSTKFLLIVSISMTLALLALYIWERKKGYYTGII